MEISGSGDAEGEREPTELGLVIQRMGWLGGRNQSRFPVICQIAIVIEIDTTTSQCFSQPPSRRCPDGYVPSITQNTLFNAADKQTHWQDAPNTTHRRHRFMRTSSEYNTDPVAHNLLLPTHSPTIFIHSGFGTVTVALSTSSK